jgi:hypothetical protein
MSGYLEGYGVGEEKREKTVKRMLVVLAVILIVGGGTYLFFRNYFEVRTAKSFLETLRNKDYQAAYRFWCPPVKPCPDYPMEKFLEDWGPKSVHADLSSLDVVKTRGCSTGVIVKVTFGKENEADLWVARQDKIIGFAPWPVCNPRLPAP